jgi:AraC-like DNA-binding protein
MPDSAIAAPATVTRGTVSAVIVQQFFRRSVEIGLPPERVLLEAGVSEAEINDPSGWVAQSVLERMLRMALRLWPDPVLGLRLVADMSPAAFGVLGYLMQSCASLRDMHKAVTSFERLLTNVMLTSLDYEPGLALWRVDCLSDDADFVRHACESYLGICAMIIQSRTPGILLGVRFRHASPGDEALLAVYQRVFQCPVFFGQASAALMLSSLGLNQPLPDADSGLHETLLQHAGSLLSRVRQAPPLVDQVRVRLRGLLAQGVPSRDVVAAQLGMSSRHLHRQLEKLGTGYQEILDALRLELAQEYLRDTGRDLSEVAECLGFREANSFSRWFRSLAGVPPQEFRRQHRGV